MDCLPYRLFHWQRLPAAGQGRAFHCYRRSQTKTAFQELASLDNAYDTGTGLPLFSFCLSIIILHWRAGLVFVRQRRLPAIKGGGRDLRDGRCRGYLARLSAEQPWRLTDAAAATDVDHSEYGAPRSGCSTQDSAWPHHWRLVREMYSTCIYCRPKAHETDPIELQITRRRRGIHRGKRGPSKNVTADAH